MNLAPKCENVPGTVKWCRLRMMDQLPVLIIGAGPTGLTMACNLVRFGVKFRIIDKAPTQSTYSRAIVIQPRTMELFYDLGITERLISEGKKIFTVNGYIDGTQALQLVTHPLEKLNTQFPFLLSVPEATTERIMEEKLQAFGVKVERGVTFVSATDEDGIKVKLINSKGIEEEVNTLYLLGCDGARSEVRKNIDVEFKGHADDQHFLLADLELDWKYSDDAVHAFLSKKGTLAFLPLPGKSRFRLVSPLNSDEIKLEASQETLKKILKTRGWLDKLSIINVGWISIFSLQYRCASSFRKGNVFLLGDAAHNHNPVGGLGMNMGIHDATNLSWKLALVLQNIGRKELLDSYNWERRPIAQKTLRGTEFATNIVAMKSSLFRWFRINFFKNTLKFKAYSETIIKRISLLNNNYRQSVVSFNFQTPFIKGWYRFRSSPLAGDRMPDVRSLQIKGDETKYSLSALLKEPTLHLLIFLGQNFTDDVPESYYQLVSNLAHYYGSLITPHLVVPFAEFPFPHSWKKSVIFDPEQRMHTTFGASTACIYLIRPDKHIGFRSHPIDEEALFKYLDQIFY